MLQKYQRDIYITNKIVLHASYLPANCPPFCFEKYKCSCSQCSYDNNAHAQHLVAASNGVASCTHERVYILFCN